MQATPTTVRRPMLRWSAVLLAASLALAACGADEPAPAAEDPAPIHDDEPGDEGATTEDPAAPTDDEAASADDPAMTGAAVQDGSGAMDAPEEHPGGAHGHHHHDLVATDLDLSVALDVVADPMSGWNVHIQPSGFSWAPEHVNGEVVDGEGHAHLYIDGERWGRVYTSWIHVNDDLAPGPHEFRVTLNANDHRDYAIDGQVVGASTLVEVPDEEGTMAHGQHGTADAAADMAVEVEVHLDAMRGINLALATSGFTWAPQHASTRAIDGEGHAHVYLDGEKLGRLYGDWIHLGRELEPGEHEVRVTLNANDHRDYAIDGQVVEAVATFTVPD